MQSLEQQVASLAQQSEASAIGISRTWVRTPFIHAYLRVGVRAINGQSKTIEIANVDVKDKYQNQGKFRNLCEILEKQFKNICDIIYVENVNSDRLHSILQRNGYSVYRIDGFGKTYFKPIN